MNNNTVPSFFTCAVCDNTYRVGTNRGTDYGVTKEGARVCYYCCGLRELDQMKETGKAALYDCDGEVTNWPGTLRFKVTGRTKGRHNLAGCQYRVRFEVNGEPWIGTRFGDNTQLIHCRRARK